MSSTSETGHAINVANLEDLISFATGYTTKYNPSRTTLKIPALQILLTTAQGSITVVTMTENAFDKTTNARKDAFKSLKPFVTKIINALDATDATPNTIADAKRINKKIQGTKEKTILPDPTPTAADAVPAAAAKHISSSQQSYDRLVDHFSKLVDLLQNEPAYAPNEVELKVVTLQALLTTLKNTNTAVIKANVPYSNARANRDVVLYATSTGLLDTVIDVKKYVKSVYGASSPQYKQVAGLKFTRIRK